MKVDRDGVAERLRGLIGAPDKGDLKGDLAETAARLGIEELSLRMSIDELSPHPTIEVLAAVIRVYGVDPTWLLTGDYDGTTHRNAEHGGAVNLLRELMGALPRRISEPPPENFKLNESN